MYEKKVDTILTQREIIYSLPIETLMGEDKLEEIKRKGYSRIPLYMGHGDNFIFGILITKSLVGIDPHNPMSIKDLFV